MSAPDVAKYLSGEPVTLRYLSAWLENPPPQADNAARRRMEKLRDQYQTALRRRQCDGYGSVIDAVTATCDRVRDFLTIADPDDIVGAVKAGRLDPDEAKAQVQQLMRESQNARARVESVERDCVAATDSINRSPEDFEEERVAKYGNWVLPVVSEHWLLTGDPDLDPMKDKD
jgi:hypothetical protein